MDRRIRKTRQLIQSAFTDLMLEKKLNEITVTELTSAADIDRRTFYLHYEDIYDLYRKTQEEFLEDYRQFLDKEDNTVFLEKHPIALVRLTFQFLKSHQDICRINMGMNYNKEVIALFKKIVREKYTVILKRHYKNCTDQKLNLFFSYCFYGIMGLIEERIRTNPKIDAREGIMVELAFDHSSEDLLDLLIDESQMMTLIKEIEQLIGYAVRYLNA